MTAQPRPVIPGVIPYVEYYDGTVRVLTLELSRPGHWGSSRITTIASIDGRQYTVVWGEVNFEIPAERNVHVSVHISAEYLTQHASFILPPGEPNLRYVYRTSSSGMASLTLAGR